jgi:hypothetical protein
MSQRAFGGSKRQSFPIRVWLGLQGRRIKASIANRTRTFGLGIECAVRSSGIAVHWRKMVRQILSSSMVVLMLCASALGAACDLSCGFAPDRSDCHTQQAQTQDSAPTTMKMGNIDMPGMAMPGMASSSSTDREMVSNRSQGMPAHAALVEMNTCARQSCDQAQTSAGQANRFAATHCDVISGIVGFSYSNTLQATFRDARDDVAPRNPEIQRPLSISLRI